MFLQHQQFFIYTILVLHWTCFQSVYKLQNLLQFSSSRDKTEVNNNRPISILSPFSKLLEKLISSRAVAFFDKHPILLPIQHCIPPNHSTLPVLPKIVNMNSNEYTAFFFLI